MNLAVLGPWQIIAILVLIALPGLILLIVFTSRAKHKSRAETLDEVLNNKQSHEKDKFETIERLNKLRESGALTQEEFEEEKRKVLAN